MADVVEVKVPDIGDYTDVPVIEVLVKPGDHVEAEAPLITLESDKATMEVPAPQAGTVKSVGVKEGDSVSKGSVVLKLEVDAGTGVGAEAGDGDASPEPRPAPASDAGPARAEAEPPTAAAAPAQGSSGATSAAGGGVLEVKVPDIGDYTDVPVIEVLVKPGDAVEADAPLVTLESDKATMEVPAPQAGTVKSVAVKEGDAVSQGSLVCTLETRGADASAADATPGAAGPEAPSEASDEASEVTPVEDDAGEGGDAADADLAARNSITLDALPRAPIPPPVKGPRGATPHASPAVRKYARELGADLSAMQGSGRHGRILREDVQHFVKGALRGGAASGADTAGAAATAGIPPIPAVDFSKFGPIETRPLKRIRKLSAAHLQRAWLNLPHVTQTDNADITDLEAFRRAQNSKRGQKLTLLPLLLKAVARAIDEYPEFASSLSADGQSLVMKHYRHIGFAADTENGLLVPVVRDVNRKGVIELARETADLAKKARSGKLSLDEMKGGVFSISSLGGIGGSHFTPIINAPEVGILGVSRAEMQPRWDGNAFQPRLMLPLSLSYDHRVIDGAYAARFIVYLCALLGDLRRLVL